MIQRGDFWFPLEHKDTKTWMRTAGLLNDALPFVKRRDCAVDCGAFVGVWTKKLAGCFHKVIAFEPDEEAFACLEKNTDNLNSVILHNCAVWSQRTHMGMVYTGPESPFKRLNGDGTIECVMIDEIITEADFIKLDVEWAETEALKGARHLIGRCRPVIVIEQKKPFGQYGPVRPEDWLIEQGYKTVLVRGCDFVMVPR